MQKKTGRPPEERACRLTKRAIRRSEECACWLDCLWSMRKDESRVEAVPPVKTLGDRYPLATIMTIRCPNGLRNVNIGESSAHRNRTRVNLIMKLIVLQRKLPGTPSWIPVQRR